MQPGEERSDLLARREQLAEDELTRTLDEVSLPKDDLEAGYAALRELIGAENGGLHIVGRGNDFMELAAEDDPRTRGRTSTFPSPSRHRHHPWCWELQDGPTLATSHLRICEKPSGRCSVVQPANAQVSGYSRKLHCSSGFAAPESLDPPRVKPPIEQPFQCGRLHHC